MKHHVFSARTTEEGLKVLNELKAKLNISWDQLVIDAICDHYGLDKAVMAIPVDESKLAEKVTKTLTREKEKADKAALMAVAAADKELAKATKAAAKTAEKIAKDNEKADAKAAKDKAKAKNTADKAKAKEKADKAKADAKAKKAADKAAETPGPSGEILISPPPGE